MRQMRLSLIAFGATAGALLLSNGAFAAGNCATQLDMLSKQLAATDPSSPPPGIGPTGVGPGGTSAPGTVTPNAMIPNPFSPSGAPAVQAAPGTIDPNGQATVNRSIVPPDPNPGAGAANSTNTAALDAIQQAQQANQAGDELGCMEAVTRAQDALITQP
jgi:hypothetical protein